MNCSSSIAFVCVCLRFALFLKVFCVSELFVHACVCLSVGLSASFAPLSVAFAVNNKGRVKVYQHLPAVCSLAVFLMAILYS